MSTINRLRNIADVRPRRTSRSLATVSVTGRGFSPIEDDFFAREAELYEARGSEEDDFESSEAAARRSRMLVPLVVLAAAAVVSFVELRPNVLAVQALIAKWHGGTEDSILAPTSLPVLSPSTASATSPAAIVRSAPDSPRQELVQPKREASQEAPPAMEAPAANPRRVSKSSAKFASALSKCRTESSAEHVRRALDACRKAVALQRHSPEALTLLARAEIDRHHSREAQRLAAGAISSDPKFTDAYIVMGRAHQQAGQKAQARASYRQYLALAPHGRYAGEVRMLLNRGL